MKANPKNRLIGQALFYEGELKVYACPIGACPIEGTFFAELCSIMTGFDRGQRLG
jgi:hypothetical protein